MKLSVIGAGYLGAVHATAMASLGFEVVGVDVDETKIDSLKNAQAPFYEPGFDDLLAETTSGANLSWSNEYADLADADVHFLCVGTPQKRGSHQADLTYVFAAVSALLPHLKPGCVIAGKSTVPVGTADQIADAVAAEWRRRAESRDPQADALGEMPIVVWNPEFLREGFAVQDTLSPDRIVVGVPGGEAANDRAVRAEQQMRAVYASQIADGIPFLVTDRPTAELVKVAANAFLATKISFINAMAEVCEATGADVLTLADAIGHDDRIGRKFLGAGVGFGGGCLPKDIRAFSARAGELGVDQALTFLREVDQINYRRRERAVETTRDLLGGTFGTSKVTILGAAFKPNSDDVRDSPALDIAAKIFNEGAQVVVHDPKALANAAARFPQLTYEADLAAALTDADVVVLLTEWQEYRDLDPAAAMALVNTPRILDGRNALDALRWRVAGWTFRGMGREHG